MMQTRGWTCVKERERWHVVECDQFGYITNRHVLSLQCRCKPQLKDLVIIHNPKRAIRTIH